MISIGAAQLEGLADALDKERSFVDALYEVLRGLPTTQKAWFRSGGASSHASLSSGTIRLRERRIGYYRARRAPGVTAAAPFGVYTENTLRHTSGLMGRVQVLAGVATIQHDLKRWWVTSWWDVRSIEKRMSEVFETRLSKIFDRKRVAYSRRAA